MMFFKSKYDSTEIGKKIKEIIIKKFNLKMKCVEIEENGIIEMYGLNSIGVYECFILIEKKFKIKFDDSSVNFESFNSIPKLIELVKNNLNGKKV